MQKIYLIAILTTFSSLVYGQLFQAGMETVTGPAVTSFKGDLASVIGISEVEISEGIIDSAFASIDVDAPKWLRELFPGVRIDIEGNINRKLTRNVKGVRFFARFKWFGGSFTISDPRLTTPEASKKLKNQVKAIRLSLSGNAEELAKHLGKVALADANRVKPFFSNRYDLEGYFHFKKFILGDAPLLEFGKGNSIDFEAVAGMRFTVDPSPVVDLGSLLFISEKLDSLMEGRLLDPVEDITDQAAIAVQNIIFGKFRDPRTVPSFGWFIRSQALLNLGGSFTITPGFSMSVNKHLSVNGTKPMTSLYGFIGLRWKVIGKG